MTTHALRGRTRYPGVIDDRMIPWQPTSISGLQLWIDFSDERTLYTDAGSTRVSDDGDLIYQANDKSGNEHNATQATSASRPVYKKFIQNGLSVARFDGSDDLMECSRVYSDDDFSFFVVTKGAAQQNKIICGQISNLTDAGRTIFISTDGVTSPYEILRLFFNNGTSYRVVSTTTAFDGTAKLLYSESDGSGNSHVRVNGGSKEGELAEQTWTPANLTMKIGAQHSSLNFYTGDIMEIVGYTSLSDGDRQTVESYLNIKWDIY